MTPIRNIKCEVPSIDKDYNLTGASPEMINVMKLRAVELVKTNQGIKPHKVAKLLIKEFKLKRI